MNDLLIENLSAQAIVNTNSMSPNGSKNSNWKREFTRLIVNECAKSLCPELRSMISRSTAVDIMKDKFGING